MIIRGGINIYPEEIEAVLLAHPDVTDAAVVGYPVAGMGEEVAAFVVSGDALDEDTLRAWCAERLAPYKLPRVIRRIDALPRNSLGKVQKALLKTALGETKPS
jgi:acyl-CoA synthetase (AMP-forming)/AMP-acid ligase II